MDWLKDEKKKKENLLKDEQKMLEWVKRLHKSGAKKKIERMVAKINAATDLSLSVRRCGSITEKRLFQETRDWATGWEVKLERDKQHFLLEANEAGAKLTFTFYLGVWGDSTKHESMDIEIKDISEAAIKAWIGRLVAGE